MLKSSAGNAQSVQMTTWAICGSGETFCTVKSVCVAVVCGDLKSTSKYGRSSVAAGCTAMSQLSSLFVVVGLIVDVPANVDVASIDARRTAENRMANDLPPDHYVNRFGGVAFSGIRVRRGRDLRSL